MHPTLICGVYAGTSLRLCHPGGVHPTLICGVYAGKPLSFQCAREVHPTLICGVYTGVISRSLLRRQQISQMLTNLDGRAEIQH